MEEQGCKTEKLTLKAVEDDKTFSRKLSPRTLPQPQYVSLPQINTNSQWRSVYTENYKLQRETADEKKSVDATHRTTVSQESEVIKLWKNLNKWGKSWHKKEAITKE